METSIDIARLEKVRIAGNKLQSRCPACAADGSDKSGTHFFLNLESGKWGCASHAGDSEHRREIFRIVGVHRETTDEERRAFALQRRKEAAERFQRENLTRKAANRRKSILASYAWTPHEVAIDSPYRLEETTATDAQLFLRRLFRPADTIWTGEVFHSGSRHADHWQTARDWQTASPGPMVCPAVWAPGTDSRIKANVIAAPFIVLDFDELPTGKPTTAAEIEDLKLFALASCRFLREKAGMRLAAILSTGGKGLQCWFENPGSETIRELKTVAAAWGIDAGLIDHPEHPCRLPGQRHQKTGGISRLLWLR